MHGGIVGSGWLRRCWRPAGEDGPLQLGGGGSAAVHDDVVGRLSLTALGLATLPSLLGFCRYWPIKTRAISIVYKLMQRQGGRLIA